MTTPFDAIAPHYDALWTSNENGWRQRSEVWRAIDGLFRRGDVILDLGCGTGDDAVHLSASRVRTIAIDASPRMVDIARSRGVAARRLRIEQISTLSPLLDGAISNFGALNCVQDLEAVGRELGRLIRPGRPIALCFLSRIFLRETAAFLLDLKFRKAFRRWSGHANWLGMDVFYPTSRQIRRAFDPCFRFKRRLPIGGGDHNLYIFERRTEC